MAALNAVREQVLKDPSRLMHAFAEHPHLIQTYSSCTDMEENRGHRFGEDLSDADKNVVLVKGSVPGPKGGTVIIRDAIKHNSNDGSGS